MLFFIFSNTCNLNKNKFQHRRLKHSNEYLSIKCDVYVGFLLNEAAHASSQIYVTLPEFFYK